MKMLERFTKKKKSTQYIFLHVPKTAGTTFRAILERNYPEREICAVYPNNAKYHQPDQVSEFSQKKKDGFACFFGHVSFGFHKRIGRDIPYIAFLRNPVDRVISLYHHIMSHDRRFAEKKISIVKFIQGYKNIQADNQQVRILSGANPTFGRVTEEMLWNAIENIENRFAFVGLTEYFDESLLLLNEKLELRKPWYVNDNVSRSRPGKDFFSGLEMDVIRKFNYLDLVLYAYVKRRLLEKISPHFQESVEKFREENEKRARSLKPTTVWNGC